MNNTRVYEWVDIKRGDTLPKNSIYSCTTRTDGPVYIGGFDNIPGKVNLDNKKIWNIWVRDLGSRQNGKILVMNTTYRWKEIKRGDIIPKNALYCGLDNCGDRVWVGRTTQGVPGKINCEQYIESDQYTMHNLWTHENWTAFQKAHILVYDEIIDTENKNLEKNKLETNQNKLNYLFEPNNDYQQEIEKWTIYKTYIFEKNI